jgi:hypothetical protein
MVHALVDAGEQVVVIDNLLTGFECAVPKGVPLVLGNVGMLPSERGSSPSSASLNIHQALLAFAHT